MGKWRTAIARSMCWAIFSRYCGHRTMAIKGAKRNVPHLLQALTAISGKDSEICRRWRPPYQTGKTVHEHAKHYIHNEDGRTAPGVCGNGSVPLSHSGNVVTRIGIHTHTFYFHFKSFHLKLLISRRKFSGKRKFTLKYQ